MQLKSLSQFEICRYGFTSRAGWRQTPISGTKLARMASLSVRSVAANTPIIGPTKLGSRKRGPAVDCRASDSKIAIRMIQTKQKKKKIAPFDELESEQED